MPDSSPRDFDDLAIDFALGILNPDEESSVLEEAKRNPELERLLREQCAAHEQARAEGLPARQTSHLSRHRPWIGRRVGVAAALIAASIALVLWLRPSSPEHYWLPVDAILTTPRSAPTQVDGLREAVRLYARHDLDNAIAGLEAIDTEGAARDLKNIYLASSLLNAGHVAGARTTLNQITVEELPFPWRDYAREIGRRIHDAEAED